MSMPLHFQRSALVTAIASIEVRDFKPMNSKKLARDLQDADDGADWDAVDNDQADAVVDEVDDADDVIEAITLPPISDEERRARANELRRVIGQRMRAARELCGFSASDAANKLGMTVRALERIESPIGRVPNHPEILAAAGVYEVSIDFLYGATESFETDFGAAQRRAAGAWLFKRFEQNWRDQLAKFAQLDRRLEKIAGHIEAMTDVANENQSAINSMRERNPSFDDMMGGARVVRLTETLVRRGAEGRALLKRFCLESGAAG